MWRICTYLFIMKSLKGKWSPYTCQGENRNFSGGRVFFLAVLQDVIWIGQRWGVCACVCVSVSFNSLPPHSLLCSNKCWVQGHIIAYWTAETDCTSSAHGCGHFLPLAPPRKTGWPIFALNYSTIFMAILVRETEPAQPSGLLSCLSPCVQRIQKNLPVPLTLTWKFLHEW